MVRNLPVMQETSVPSLGCEDPLEEDRATHSSILAQKIPMKRGAWRAAVHGGRKESDTTEDSAQHTAHKVLSTLVILLTPLII